MYLKCHKRLKDGKEHRYWSVVESVRTRRGVIKRQLLCLGEINDAQRAQWCSALDVLDDGFNYDDHDLRDDEGKIRGVGGVMIQTFGEDGEAAKKDAPEKNFKGSDDICTWLK